MKGGSSPYAMPISELMTQSQKKITSVKEEVTDWKMVRNNEVADQAMVWNKKLLKWLIRLAPDCIQRGGRYISELRYLIKLNPK